MVFIRNKKFPRAILTPWKDTMKNFLNFIAITLMVAIVVAGLWTCLLGAEGMAVFYTSILCGAALAVATKGSFLSSPWSVAAGLALAGILLGIPAKLIPGSNAQYGHLAESAGLTLVDASRIQSFALYGTVFVFLAFGLIQLFQPKSKPTQMQTTNS
jgi:hypothetical protein